jgi:hypothetical protein
VNGQGQFNLISVNVNTSTNGNYKCAGYQPVLRMIDPNTPAIPAFPGDALPKPERDWPGGGRRLQVAIESKEEEIF